MLFNSLSFLIFFAIVFPVFLLIPAWRTRKLFLLLASYIFYAAWNPGYVLILFVSTSLDWWLARRIWRAQDPSRRKALLLVSLVANLGLLAFFKYGGFVLDNSQQLLSLADITWVPPAWNVVLPVGISFYTFASLSYTIDVYRREIEGDTPFGDYALFVAFFPHLVAGPIVRAKALLPQLAVEHRANLEQVSYGITLVILGIFCKAVLADHIFAPVVDAVYALPGKAATPDGLAAIFGFSAQIYFDFGGYSLCAIGLAMCFGFAFPDNFRYPYGASGFSDFWKRWHISLSTWLRDYLYVSLGGNRGGKAETYRNLLITMLLGGLWHGASWMFVLWGALHGAFLVAERVLQPFSRKISFRGIGALSIVITFLLVTFAWIPFRAADGGQAINVLAAVFRSGSGDARSWMALAGALVMFGWHWRMRNQSLDGVLSSLSPTGRSLLAVVCLTGIFLASGGDGRAFIYFQF